MSVAISARGRKTRLIGSVNESYIGQSSSNALVDWSPTGTKSGRTPNSISEATVLSPTAATFRPANDRASRPYSSSFSRIARTAFTEVNPIHSYRPETRPWIARSICCGVRGGSTEIVGTSMGTAPCPRSSDMIEPVVSWVRGISTRQPKSDLTSNQSNFSRCATTSPTTTMPTPVSFINFEILPTSDKVLAIVR
ncbi:unannotated protein [freshwater metagenome]|uniref:Unannotated protein n=1 Tax=freshwater metagenome TaxID=449393 RepID=A0A6J6QYL6_9ZZZZ